MANTPFRLRSQGSSFKNMGSSPVKHGPYANPNDPTAPHGHEALPDAFKGKEKDKASPARDVNPHTGMNPPHTPNSHPPNDDDGLAKKKKKNVAYNKASDKKKEKLNKAYNKRSELKSQGGDVKGGDKVDRKYRRTQNKINRLSDSKVRHRKNIFTKGKYKKVVKD
jgi:hypothetical protein